MRFLTVGFGGGGWIMRFLTVGFGGGGVDHAIPNGGILGGAHQ